MEAIKAKTAEKALHALLVAAVAERLFSIDASEDVQVGQTIDLSIFKLPQLEPIRETIDMILGKAQGINFNKVLDYSPFTVQYIAKGMPCDLILRDREGDHINLPSGILKFIEVSKEQLTKNHYN